MSIDANRELSAATGPAWQGRVLLFATLLCLFLIPAPSAYGTPVVGLTALGLAIYLGGIRHFCDSYRPALCALLLLVIANVSTALVPARALSGAYDLMRSVLPMLPALWVAERAPRDLVLAGLKACAAALSLAFALLCLSLGDSPDLMGQIYAWCELHFGNVHNLINLSTIVLLALVVILAFERAHWQRLVFLGLLSFGLWFQWLLESEGTYLALVFCVFAWVALRFGGWLRILAVLALLGAVIGYGLLMAYPEAFKSATRLSLGGFEIRAGLNARLLDLVADRPWFGYGMSNYKGLPGTEVEGMAFVYPHQIYLEALFSFGVVGSVLFAAVLVGLFRYSSRAAILSDPLAMLGFLLAVYLAGKGLTDMKLIALQPLGLFMMAAGFMARRPGVTRPVPATPVR